MTVARLVLIYRLPGCASTYSFMVTMARPQQFITVINLDHAILLLMHHMEACLGCFWLGLSLLFQGI